MNTINTQKKTEIAECLRNYTNRFGSQSKAANTLKGVSAATISQVLNNNWESISDEMWRNIAAQVGYDNTGWVIVETRDFRILTQLLDDAKLNSNVFAVTGEAGTGKSLTLKEYARNNANAYFVQCAEYWNRKQFMLELLTAMGRDGGGMTVADMMSEIVRYLKMQNKPVLMLDEADKLKDQVLYFFITLYNQLEGQCGIVLCSTDFLAKRVLRGLKLNKKGYKEIYSRIARRFIELKGPNAADIAAIATENGITDRKLIKEIYEDSSNDLRRVRRKIYAIKQSLNGN
ncbi:MAG: AAA family ATPase [Bacteroidales bacterium]|jgi:DNA transposition AAA+ family ATPase